MFAEIAGNSQIHNPGLNWVATSDDTGAIWERQFYSMALARLPEDKRRQVLHICAEADDAEVEAVLYELLAHELLSRLHLKPRWHPSIGGQTPDLGFRISGQDFIADCVVLHSPVRTVKDYPDGTGYAYDGSKPGESRSHKFYVSLEQKALKYRAIGLPLVVFVFAGDLRIMNPQVLECALYGRSTLEASEEETFPSVGYAPVLTGGLLLPSEDCTQRHTNLSAAVWCDWFWSDDRSAPPAKRLLCTVCHHWAPDTPLPISTFDPLFQIAWRPAENGEWTPCFTGDPTTVIGFEADGTLTCRAYSNEAPW